MCENGKHGKNYNWISINSRQSISMKKQTLKKKNCVTEFLHQQSVKRVSF